MSAPKRQTPAGGPGSGGAWENDYRHDPTPFPAGFNPMATVEAACEQATGKPPKRMGRNVRFPCASCGGDSYKVSITEGDDGRVLIHCFGSCRAEEVLAAVGLRLGDLYPPRNWPQSPEERRRARVAIRQAGWAAALSVLSLEATITLFAAREVHSNRPLSIEDGRRLALAVKRIDHAASVLVEVRQ